jgi:flagellin-specific chaperone FliS
MNPYTRYQQAEPNWTRIDMLLALYDGAIQRCEQALEALDKQDEKTAQARLIKARLIVMGLVSGVVADDEVTTNILRLCEYVLHVLEKGGRDNVRAALNVLRILRDGFQKIRPEAAELERQGAIPPINTTSTVRMLA